MIVVVLLLCGIKEEEKRGRKVEGEEKTAGREDEQVQLMTSNKETAQRRQKLYVRHEKKNAGSCPVCTFGFFLLLLLLLLLLLSVWV